MPSSQPAVILVHGATLNGRSWDPVRRLIDPRLHVLAPDLPGFGESAPLRAEEVQLFFDGDSAFAAILEAVAAASLLEIHLETGRTHQIRVHMSAVRHPCVGDLTYGADPVLASRLGLTRQWLHAVRLGFQHPATGEWQEFESPYPADLQQTLDLVHT